MSEQMKILISLNGGKSSVGISKTDCDPIFNVVEGGLDSVVTKLPELVKAAEEKWATAPRNPPANLPQPTPKPASSPAPRVATATAKPKENIRPSLF